MRKIIGIVLRIIITLLIWGAGGYVLNRYAYLENFNDIDNVVGMMPVAFVLMGSVAATILLWIRHTRQRYPVSAVLALFVILPVVLFPTAITSNWWISVVASQESEATPDLTPFTPFIENAKTAKLDSAPTLTLTDTQPVLDGAIALYPVYAAFAEAVYDESVFSQDTVLCTNTRGAFEAIIANERDIIFTADASAQQMTAANEAGVDLWFTPIGREAFVFIVGKDNPINNITYRQLRNIYSGKTANWRTIGWREGGGIIAFQRPEGSGSQTGLQRMVMKNLPIQVPQPLPDAGLIGVNSLMKQVSAKWRGVQPALGYSYKYFATVMHANPDTKLLAVDGAEPSIENIQNGSYPFVSNFYAVTNGKPEGHVKRLIDWILSPQGQEIIEKTGYTPLAATAQ